MNNAYPSDKWGRRYKSKELASWEKEFLMWVLFNREVVQQAKIEFEAIPATALISVDCIFNFRQEKIFCKDGRAKRLDADNRLKCLLDQVTKLVGIDDCRIFRGSFEKRITTERNEGIDIFLSILPDARGCARI